MRLAPFLVPLAAVGAFVIPPAAAQPPQAEDTATTYLRDCGVCHGSRGEGTRQSPPIAGLGRAIVDYEISTGRMPIADPDDRPKRKAVRYSPEQIGALVDHVAAFAPGGDDIPSIDLRTADVAGGGVLYRLHCAACHAWAGDGGALVEQAAPGLHKATPLQIAEAIRTGPGTMPAFGSAALDDEELAAVVAYATYLRDPDDRGGFGLWHLGPVAEGAVAWILGVGLLVLGARWIGDRE